MDHPDIIEVIIGQLTTYHGIVSLVCKQWQLISQRNINRQVYEFMYVEDLGYETATVTAIFQIGPMVIKYSVIDTDHVIWFKMKFPSCSVSFTYSIENSCPQCYTDFQYNNSSPNHEFFQRVETWIQHIGLGHLLPSGNRVLCWCDECNFKYPFICGLNWKALCYATPRIISLTPTMADRIYNIRFQLRTDKVFNGLVSYVGGTFSPIIVTGDINVQRYPLNPDIEAISGNYQYLINSLAKRDAPL